MTLYVAVLSSGWWRRELGGILIPKILTTPGIKAGLENPTLTWDVPYCGNLNGIRKRFLESGYEYLLIIDHDTVPIQNPAELVFADRDIIGIPTLTRLKSGKVVWNVYQKWGDKYRPIDIEKLNVNTDLFEIDAHGFACVIIKRCVLEKLIFKDIYDEDGIRIKGCDLEYCGQAKAMGFKIWTALKMRCEHFKETGLKGLIDSLKEENVIKH